MSEAITVIAFYFAALSLASTLFFNRVEAWHGPIRSFEVHLNKLGSVKEWEDAEKDRKLHSAGAPNLFATLVSILAVFLTFLAFKVPIPLCPPFDPLVYLRLPLVTVAGMFWVLGFVRFLDGHRRLHNAQQRITDLCIKKRTSGNELA